IVLDEASRVASDVSLSVLMSRYGAWIFVISLITIAILLLLSFGVARSRKLLRYQNKRYELLFELSEGYLFEFSLDEELLSLSPQSSSLQAQYHLPEERIIEYLKEIIAEDESGQINTALTLHDIEGKMATYRLQMFRQEKEAEMQGDWIGLLSDISADEKEKAVLRSQADTDGLTGVLNQVAFRKQVERVLQSREDGSFDVFILLDFDNFKEINDTYGHLEGNRHLQGLASLLKTLFSEAEVLGRVGGDEFALYLSDVRSLDETRELAEAINPAYQRRLESSFTLSVGVAKVEKGDTFDTLFNRADVALYASKRAGGNTITLRQ
ncbi:MAG TPA: GGDEF domain-containing protein, partial [Sphaerochaeta sp.]|nr:GGDEF domain-containing protein [Sphaerochaeta sp.]